ncbi:Glucosidase 2 subunit beta [Varanus komodoensis]|nr:Glucosidase 2 subunit beta [Varanus komodoensis]
MDARPPPTEALQQLVYADMLPLVKQFFQLKNSLFQARLLLWLMNHAASVSSALASAVEVKRPRGVSLTNHHFYDESKPFTCLDGSAMIAFDRVNDDYCDCKDGSDEPGTAACPNGRFHCSNAGYRPQYIPSSRVNDGICDCCDATDEYNSGIVCENTCKEMGRKEREELKQKAEVAREGFEIKKTLMEEASKRKEEKQKKLTELQESKKTVEEQVEVLKSLKDAAEKPEKEAKEIHQKAWEEQKATERAARDQAKAEEAFRELDDDLDGMVSIAELQTHSELDVDGDGILSETEAQEDAIKLRGRGAGRGHKSVAELLCMQKVPGSIHSILSEGQEGALLAALQSC